MLMMWDLLDETNHGLRWKHNKNHIWGTKCIWKQWRSRWGRRSRGR